MPDPRQLRVGDRVRFVSLPAEWCEPGYRVPRSDGAFLRLLIARRRPCRVARIEADGYPWIDARVRRSDGRVEHHSWGLYERTGWKRVGVAAASDRPTGSGPAAGRGPPAG